MKVSVQHLRTVPAWNGRRGFCHAGARRFFSRHGLDWNAFVRDGIEAEELSATGDALALRLVQWAEEQSNGR